MIDTAVKKERALLSRDNFREAVFARDSHKCVFCDLPAVDAHHILERRLWADGGYYVDNGASVCEQHHIECEKTAITVEEVRQACGILKPILPEHLYDDEIYDKWGNIILQNGLRLRGELFFDESVQKILKEGNMLGLFTNRVKYPRTYHLPWSEGITSDDRMHPSVDHFAGRRVIVMDKYDGENTTMYFDAIHARSVDGRHHPSRDWVKNLWGQIRYDIPKDWRLCGENMFAKHSIEYNNLESYFFGFAMWNDRNICLSWDDSKLWFELLGIKHVPVLYDGIYDEKLIRKLYVNDRDYNSREGYVMRIADSFAYSQFRFNVAKFVRKNHIQTTKHWMMGQAIVQNQLRT